MSKKDFLQMIVGIVLVQIVGVLGSFSMSKESLHTWYKKLLLSDLNPPDWLFGIVWPCLYTLLGIVGYLLYKKWQENRKNRGLLYLFGVHIFFNGIWPICFFYLHMITLAFVDIIILFISLMSLMMWAYRVDKKVTYLLLPYFVWICLATYLQGYIWYMN